MQHVATPSTEDRTRKDVDVIVSLTALLVGGSSLLGLGSRLLQPQPPGAGVMVGSTIVAVCIACVVLVRRGHGVLAGRALLSICWLGVGAISATRGGLYSGTVGLYLLCTVLAGVIISARAAIVVCALSVPACLALLVAEGQGLIRTDVSMTLAQRGLTATLTLAVTTAVLLVALRRLRDSLARTDADRRELESLNRQLLETKASLEETVAARTQSLEQARDEALAAARAKVAFLANMSHELRTPMHALLGITELLKGGALPPESQTELLEIASRSGDAMVTMLDDVLDLAKASAGRLSIDKAPFDPGAVVDDVVALLEPQALKKGLALDARLTGALPALVEGDRVRLRQVLTNLVGNALKFTERGTVDVVVSGADGHLRFEVVDTGIGIAPEALSRLFQPFVQVDASTTRRYGGTGLGLAISRQLVELMGGTIGATSEPGRGSRFWFTVKLPTVEARALPPPEAPTPGHAPLRVLLAEDNAVNQRVATRMLEQLGHRVVVVGNGAAALERLSSESFDVVLMDVHMPELDGLEATRRIRRGPTPQPRIIALTASAMPEEREACFTAGVDDFLTKPVKLEQLRRALQLRVPSPA